MRSAYYMRHRAEVESYLAEQQRRGDEVRERIETIYPPEEGLRTKLLARIES